MERTNIKEAVNNIGKEVKLDGWVATRRDHGKLVFLDLRDRSGVVQVVGDGRLGDFKMEDVVEIIGLVKERPEKMINNKIPTGKIEVDLKSVEILGKSKDLPFPLDTDGRDIDEEIRLKYRYLDLRRPRMLKNLVSRHKVIKAMRNFFDERDFIEVETPIITKTTPEGARDFIVPSRMQPGKFYALPQSPQQYKQLLMVAGIEKYYQIARCFRDEDPRADRAYGEFTQIDLEMSFVKREDVMEIIESMLVELVEKSTDKKILYKPFPRFSFKEALENFGADKFDLRQYKKIGNRWEKISEGKENLDKNTIAFSWVIDYPFFEKDKEGGWTFTHNPFSSPIPEHKDWLLKKEKIGEILTTQYDCVCNGYEVGGGSIRGHEPETLEAVFEVMGYPKEEIYQKFGHMLEAFSYGAPPHGGIALGIERLLMVFNDELTTREVVAFPMISSGQTSIMEAPSEASEKQLRELGISVQKKAGSGQELFERIVELLKDGKMEYKSYDHQPVLTSEEAAKTRGTKIEQGAKALLMMADDNPVLVVVSASNKVETKKLKELFKIKDLRMCTPDEVISVSGTVIGAVPPFGNLMKINTIVDAGLKKNEEIVFNAGLLTKSILMKYEDWEKLVKPKVENFSI